MRKNILITGASAGIGAATARLAAAAGYNVGVGYRSDLAGATATADVVRAAGGTAVLIPGDLGKPADIDAMFARFDAELGTLHGLVNNAGIVDTTQRVEDMSHERLVQMFNVNVIGPIQCAQQAVRRMATRYGGAGGAIVNISSIAAELGSAGQYVDYAASKAAIDTFTKGLAHENAREGIRVNAVRPGITVTDIHAKGGEPGREEKLAHVIPMGRAGQADEIAETILFLLSDKSSYMTGSIIDVTGGR